MYVPLFYLVLILNAELICYDFTLMLICIESYFTSVFVLL